MKVFYRTERDRVISALLNKEGFDTVYSDLIEFAELEAASDDILRCYVVMKLADDENVLARVLGAGGEIGDGLKKAAVEDLEQILSAVESAEFDYIAGDSQKSYFPLYKSSIAAMCAAKDAKSLLELLCRHYKTLGTGIFAKYTAFLQERDGISGIENPDNASFEKLVGLEHIKSVLNDNTETLLGGGRAQNVLLFGDRGTGKSSCVKALLNKFSNRGLRVIELPKHCIGMIPQLFRKLESKPQKFVLYLDDLSFEKHEPEYRSLKVAMDGQLGGMPQNVIICATSNRRHLIKENWKDREGGDVHANDNMQEMLSLSERFGISLVFSSPNQREYLDIVAKLLADRGIEINEEIERAAIVWQMNYGGRTPRCAAQFAEAYKQ